MQTKLMRKSWAEWAVENIKEHNLCPGELPAMGMPTDVMTHYEFQQTLGAGTHNADNCNHYMNERLGLPSQAKGMVELIGHDAAKITKEDVTKGKTELAKGGPSTVVDRLKREAHTYVDTIKLRDAGKLFVPEELLNFKTFLKQFFEVKDKG